jgi:hypothetical protein
MVGDAVDDRHARRAPVIVAPLLQPLRVNGLQAAVVREHAGHDLGLAALEARGPGPEGPGLQRQLELSRDLRRKLMPEVQPKVVLAQIQRGFVVPAEPRQRRARVDRGVAVLLREARERMLQGLGFEPDRHANRRYAIGSTDSPSRTPPLSMPLGGGLWTVPFDALWA